MKFYILHFTYLIVLVFSLSVSAQNWGVWGIWNGAANAEAEDTTNDIYVSTAGSDLFNGLSTSAAKRTIGGALDIAESGDSIFVLSGTYQEEDTIDVDNITLLAYDENNKPTIFGGDTLSNFVLHEAVSADTTEKVYEQDLSSTSTTPTSAVTFYKLHVDTAGYLTKSIVYIGSSEPNNGTAKTALYILSGSTMTLVDSTTSDETTLTYSDTVHFNVTNGKYLTAGDYWLGYKANDTDGGTYSVPFNSAASSVQYGVRDGTWSGFPASSYPSVSTSSRTAVGVGIVVQKITSGSGGSNYYAAGTSDFDGLYFGVNRGNKVTALDSLSSSLDYHTANDSVYTLDTVNVIPIMRNGFIVKADNVNLNNIDFELTKTALRIDSSTNTALNNLEVKKSNFAIHSKNNQGLTLNRIYIHDNIDGVKDSSSSDFTIYNSIFAFNNNTNLQSNADTLRLVHDDFIHTISVPTTGNRNNLILNGADNIIFKNNAVYTGAGWIGEIDSAGAIDSMDYNGYGYYATPDSLFWHIGSTSYGSLTSWQASSVFDNSSVTLTSAGRNWNDLFVKDFTLTDTSQLINKGINYLTKDFANNDRDDTSDIGAYEYRLQPPDIPQNVFAFYLNDSTIMIGYDTPERADSIIAYQGYSSASDSFKIAAVGDSVYKKIQRLDVEASITSFNAAAVTDTSANIGGSVIFHHDAGDSSVIRVFTRINGSSSVYDSVVVDTSKLYVADTSYFKIKGRNSGGDGEFSSTVQSLPKVTTFTKNINTLSPETPYDYKVAVQNMVSGEYVITLPKVFTTPGNAPSQETFDIYVSSSDPGASDNNTGRSASAPIKTLSELQDRLAIYKGNDLQDTLKIGFKKGDTFNGNILIENLQGTNTYPVIFGAYGNGNDPIITNRIEISNTGWTVVSDADSFGHVWEKTITQSTRNKRLWLDGVEYPHATYYKKGGVDPAPPNGTTGTHYMGENYDPLGIAPYFLTQTTYGVNYIHRFYHNTSTNTLYVYAFDIDPGSDYNKIELAGNALRTVEVNSSSYITFQNIQFEGGMYSSVTLNGCENITFDNCSLGKDAGTAGLQIQSTATYGLSKNIDINNCVLNSEYEVYDAIENDQVVEYALAIGNGVDGIYIDSCFIKNWKFGLLVVSKYQLARNIFMSNSEFTAPNIAYGKPIQTSGSGNNYRIDSIFVYNNYFHNYRIHNQISGGSNIYFFMNIMDTVTYSLSSHSTTGNSGYGFQILGGGESPSVKTDSLIIFNNNILNTYNASIVNYYSKYEVFANNIFAQTALQQSNVVTIREGQYSEATWNNNLFYRDIASTSSDMVTIPGIVKTAGGNSPTEFSVSEFNNQDFTEYENSQGNQVEITASGNKQYMGAFGDLINTNTYKIVTASEPVEAADTSLTILKAIIKKTPEYQANSEFKDRKGNTVFKNNKWYNQSNVADKKPNIGAVNDEQ